jgi:hypothetical protein
MERGYVWVKYDTQDCEIFTPTAEDPTPSGKGWIPVITGGGVTYTYTATVNETPTAYGTLNVTYLNARQPLQARVKIDCQTPDAKIIYDTLNKETMPFAGPFAMGDNPNPSASFTMPSAPLVSATPNYTSAFSLGNAGNLRGYLYGISALAVNGAYHEEAYEKAARSVIMLYNGNTMRNWDSLAGKVGTGNHLNVWIRGGDDTSGSNKTPGFPLSWDEFDYRKYDETGYSGIRLLTSNGTGLADTDNDQYYWVSWEVNVPAYFYFMAGSSNNDTNDMKKGPLQWTGLKNTWALQYREYPLYPGASLVFYYINDDHETRVSKPATDVIEFYPDFSNSR